VRRRLVADQLYFGVEARALCSGLQRSLARMAPQKPRQARISAAEMREDLRLSEPAMLMAVQAMIDGGLLEPDGTDQYRATRKFREYAHASVVAPLSRARAKVLLAKASAVAATINARWVSNPFRIRMIAVSGGYMTFREKLAELSLWLVLRSRQEVRGRPWKPAVAKPQALRQILTAIDGLSSFVVVRVAAGKHAVQRPFSVVYLDEPDSAHAAPKTWNKVRDWGASLGRRIARKTPGNADAGRKPT
jgi:hypothetical protein